MPDFSRNQRGMIAVVLAMALMVGNDTAMKIAAANLPFSQLVFMRAAFASLFVLAILAARGEISTLRSVLRPLVAFRGLLELAGSFAFIMAITRMPIGDATAIIQIVPLLLLAAAVTLGERIGPARLAACGLGFAGALMIAAPSGQLSAAAILALATAGTVTAREMLGRRMGAGVPSLALACATCLIVAPGAAAGFFIQDWVVPAPLQLGLMLLAGILLAAGYIALTFAIRQGEVQAVAPFYFSQTVFALLASLFVFGDVPSPMALAGMALVMAAGVAVFAIRDLRETQRPSTQPS